MSRTRSEEAGAYSVLVVDMFHHDDEPETIVRGFPTLALATEYARRRTWDSVEALRRAAQSSTDLRRQWLLFGEDCCVIGQHYCGVSEIDYFVTHPATPEERDWQGIEALLPRR